MGRTAGKGGASHAHNDALSIEVSAHGRAFVIDPGSYVYTADLSQRHLFRSTAYHSTIQVDGSEQNTMNQESPFVIGDEARGRSLSWKTTRERDQASAEHSGYGRRGQSITHRRRLTFEKTDGWWLVEDEIAGEGEHTIAARFLFDAGLEVEARTVDGKSVAIAWDKIKETTNEKAPMLFVCALDVKQPPKLEPRFTSKHYGSKQPSVSACWSVKVSLPCKLRWAIVPVGVGESEEDRLQVFNLKSEI